VYESGSTDSDASCLSLACYRASDAFPLITTPTTNSTDTDPEAALPFDKLLSSSPIKCSWPRSAYGWFTVNDAKVSAVHMPPFIVRLFIYLFFRMLVANSTQQQRTADDFVDISAYARSGKNTIEVHHQSADIDLSEYVLTVFVHTPSVSETARLKAKGDEMREWDGLLDMISRVGGYPKFDWTTGSVAVVV
jgi:hypothetical protein